MARSTVTTGGGLAAGGFAQVPVGAFLEEV
jgi:hypothetical protein